jgi:hypothetical protein
MENYIPGATALIRKAGQSFDQARVIPNTACLDVQYAARLAIPRSDAPLAILTIVPAGKVLSDPSMSPVDDLGSWVVILRMASVPIFHEPVTFTAMILANNSSGAILPSAGQMPAQLTSPSRRPGIASTKLLHAERTVMSQVPV